MKQQKKKELIQEIIDASRQVSTATVMFHQALAHRAGLTEADHKYLDILLRKGPMSANDLAKHTGLTTGAVTGIIDRLEKKGLARRTGDPRDRRKLLIVPDNKKIGTLLGPLLTSLIKSNESFHEKYTLKELAFIKEYLTGVTEMVTSKIEQFRS